MFVFRAPIMYDADGCSSIDIDLAFSPSSGKLTITADEDWLKDEDRAYPARMFPIPLKSRRTKWSASC